MPTKPKTTKYMIHTLIRGEAGKYHTSLVKDLVEKFNVYPLHEVYSPHLTLKRPFEFTKTQLSELYSVLDNFAANKDPSKYTLSGVGNFGERVIFIDVQPSFKMTNTVQDLYESLKQVPFMSFDEQDEAKDFHATLTMHAREPFNYTEVRNYLNQNKTKSFNLLFDNIALLKKEDNRPWKIQKVWELKTKP